MGQRYELKKSKVYRVFFLRFSGSLVRHLMIGHRDLGRLIIRTKAQWADPVQVGDLLTGAVELICMNDDGIGVFKPASRVQWEIAKCTKPKDMVEQNLERIGLVVPKVNK